MLHSAIYRIFQHLHHNRICLYCSINRIEFAGIYILAHFSQFSPVLFYGSDTGISFFKIALALIYHALIIIVQVAHILCSLAIFGFIFRFQSCILRINGFSLFIHFCLRTFNVLFNRNKCTGNGCRCAVFNSFSCISNILGCHYYMKTGIILRYTLGRDLYLLIFTQRT
ncbi:hypothetical protein D9M68_626210 [compost metagenome]